MKSLSVMLIAGEASGDLLAAELVGALREKVVANSMDLTADVQPLRTALSPRFFGAGRQHMKEAGVEMAVDMTPYAIVGFTEVVKNYFPIRRVFRQLFKLAIERQPDVIVGVDYGGFNLRFGKAIKNYVRKHRSQFVPWNPKIVQFVSPQVWASRPGRAYTLADNYDLLLSIFPFEKNWYARRVPKLRVEFVGHPMIGRSPKPKVQSPKLEISKTLVLLPGSRRDEVRRHLPALYDAATLLKKHIPDLQVVMVLPDESLKKVVDMYCLFGIGAQILIQTDKGATPSLVSIETQVGELPDALAKASLAFTKSGTITMECAMFGVPAVVFYKTSWPTYLIGKQIANVKYLAMPNLLAGEEVFPEFIQHEATAENIARAGLALLRDEPRRRAVKAELAQVIASLGGPGAAQRAAQAILSLLP